MKKVFRCGCALVRNDGRMVLCDEHTKSFIKVAKLGGPLCAHRGCMNEVPPGRRLYCSELCKDREGAVQRYWREPEKFRTRKKTEYHAKKRTATAMAAQG